MFSDILGYKVFNGYKKDFINYLKKFTKVQIISGNPEILYNGLHDPKLHENFISKNSVIIPDGIGTVLASKIVKQPVKEKIAGIEVMESLIKMCEDEGKGIYLLGAKEEVIVKCKEKLIYKHPSLKICGSHNGYFDMKNCSEIINEIINTKPYILFAAMGSPRQEMFISSYMDILPCRIFMGVGGSFDVIAGNTKRAPEWMIRTGLEWLYRTINEPWRIKRLFSIPRFLWRVMIDK